MLKRVVLFIVMVFSTFSWSVALGQKNAKVDSLLNELKKTQPDTLKIKVLNALAKALRNTETAKALEYATQSNKLAMAQNYASGVAYSSDILGVISLHFGDSKKALYYHFIALQIFKKLQDLKGESFALNNIGAVYSQLKNYKKAGQYYQMSLNIKKQLGLFKEVSSSLINLGNIEMNNKNIPKCVSYYLLALNNSTQYKDSNNISIALINLGEAYIDTKNYSKALYYYTKALQLIEKTGSLFHKAHSRYAIGKIYSNMGNYVLAERELSKALVLATEIGSKSLRLNIYRYSYQLYKKQNNFEKALHFNELYLALNDSLYNQENAKNINEMQARFELQQKEEQIKNLNNEREIIEANKSKEILIKNFLLVVVVFISIITFITIRIIIIKQRTNRILTVKNEQIQTQQTEIETINTELETYNKELMKENVSARYEILKSKINPHFLFNNLSTLSSLIIYDQKQALSFVAKFAKLYRSILELSNTQLISLKEELEVVDSYLYLCKMKYTDSLSLNIDKKLLAMDCFIPPFSIQLLVENAVKHNNIDVNNVMMIDVYAEEDYIVVKNIFNPKADEELSTGLGQKNIIERYKIITDKLPLFESKEGWYIAKIPFITDSV